IVPVPLRVHPGPHHLGGGLLAGRDALARRLVPNAELGQDGKAAAAVGTVVTVVAGNLLRPLGRSGGQGVGGGQGGQAVLGPLLVDQPDDFSLKTGQLGRVPARVLFGGAAAQQGQHKRPRRQQGQALFAAFSTHRDASFSQNSVQ